MKPKWIKFSEIEWTEHKMAKEARTMSTRESNNKFLQEHYEEVKNDKAAIITFENGFGASIIFGSMFYCSGRTDKDLIFERGEETFEMAILGNGSLTYKTPITPDVLGYATKAEVEQYLYAIQMLEDFSEDKEWHEFEDGGELYVKMTGNRLYLKEGLEE